MAPARRMGIGGKIAVLGFAVGVAAALLAIGAGLGSRFGYWDFRAGFAALGWIAYLGAAAAAVSLAGVALSWRSARNAMVLGLVGLVLGIGVLWLPYQSRESLRASPRLPDVTTDTVNPPAFVTALAIRERDKARNSTAYGPAKAALQAEHYPDIRPVLLPVAPKAAFERSLDALRELGMEVIAADEAMGRIEATDRTFWFGFTDDVAIRVTATEQGSRVDIRSLSRIGGRDGGTNARRVRKLADRIGD